MSDLPDTYVLLARSKRPRTLAQLKAALEPKLKEILSSICLWDDDCNVGDYRFCIISYDLPGQVEIFLQFWSEPGEPVEWEVSSGKWNPPTEVYLAVHRAQRIEAAGFEMGGEAQNYQKDVDVNTPRQVAALARQVVVLLYDALDYRGQQALKVQAVADSRATLRPVYDSLSPDDFATLLERAGYACEVGDEADDEETETVTVSVRRYGIRAMALLTVRAPDDGGFEVIALGLAPPASVAEPSATEMRLLWIAGGVTASWLEHQVADWFEEQRRDKRKSQKRSSGVRPSTSRSIH